MITKFLLASIIILLLISGCTNTPTPLPLSATEAVQTAILAIQNALTSQAPTFTNTPVFTSTPQVTPSPTPTATIIPTATPVIVSICERIEISKELAFTNTRIDYPGYDHIISPQGKAFLLAEVLIENISADNIINYDFHSFSVIDINGISYPAANDIESTLRTSVNASDARKLMGSGSLIKGESILASIIFIVTDRPSSSEFTLLFSPLEMPNLSTPIKVNLTPIRQPDLYPYGKCDY